MLSRRKRLGVISIEVPHVVPVEGPTGDYEPGLGNLQELEQALSRSVAQFTKCYKLARRGSRMARLDEKDWE
ncbi:unnamed protein product [Pieris macdunnoughi]|uniref:Uncharacterized protein n=1 Tax=Pieris macdunnoughi TaxID=345717 RepID=A0A821UYS7_9NEOP|nr:unnamed protein product [Pieris macdunnoughi]